MKEKPNLIELIPILFMLIGMVLYWLKIDPRALFLTVGFLILGAFFLFQEIKIKTTAPLYRIVRIILPLLVIVLAMQGLIYGDVNFLSLLITITMYSLISKRLNPILKKS